MVLRELPGDRIEGRWNTLMDQLDYDQIFDGGVYLQPQQSVDQDSHDIGAISK